MDPGRTGTRGGEGDGESLITAEAAAMVGDERPPRSELVEAGAVRRWGRAVMLGDRAWDHGEAVPATFFLGAAKGAMGPVAAAGGVDPDEDQLYWLPPLRSQRTFNGGDHVRLHAPLRVGEVVTRRSRLEDVVERRTRDGRRRAVVTSLTTFDVGDDTRITWRNYTITLPEEEPTAPGGSVAPGDTGGRSPEASAPAAGAGGPAPLAATVGPVEICRFAGVNEEFALQHIDKDFARDRLGLPTVTIMGWLKLSLMATALERWAGPGSVVELTARYRGVDLAGDRLVVEPVRTGGGDGVASVDVAVVNQRGERNTEGNARVRAPR